MAHLTRRQVIKRIAVGAAGGVVIGLSQEFTNLWFRALIAAVGGALMGFALCLSVHSREL